MHGELGPTSATLPWAFPGARDPFLLLQASLQVAWCSAGWEGRFLQGKLCGRTPALSAYVAPLPHLPNAALPGDPLWVLLHSFLLTPRGLGEAHSTPSLTGQPRRGQ